MKILSIAILLACLFPAFSEAQWGSVGSKSVGTTSYGSGTATTQRNFFVYQPVEVTETVTTTMEQVAAVPVVYVESRRSRVKADRAPLIASPRLQRRVAARTALVNRATAETRAIASGF